MKKTLSIVLALVMVFAMSVPVFASSDVAPVSDTTLVEGAIPDTDGGDTTPDTDASGDTTPDTNDGAEDPDVDVEEDEEEEDDDSGYQTTFIDVIMDFIGMFLRVLGGIIGIIFK